METIRTGKKDYLKQYAWQGERMAKSSLEAIKASFEGKALWYRYFIKDYLPQDKEAPILDAPCGHGNFLYFLKLSGYRNFRGVDIDPTRVRIAKQLGLPAEVGDAFSMIEQAEDLALIVSLDFLEHIEKQEVPKFLHNCWQALKSGGCLIVRTPFTDSILGAYDLGNDFTHKWAANSGVIEGLFYEAGFYRAVVKDERPVCYKWLNYLRLGIFHFAKTLTNLYLIALGFGPLRVWSRSGYVIGYKD